MVSTAPLVLVVLSPPLVLLEAAALVDALDPLPPALDNGPSSLAVLFLFDPAVAGVGVGSLSESETSITSVRAVVVDRACARPFLLVAEVEVEDDEEVVAVCGWDGAVV